MATDQLRPPRPGNRRDGAKLVQYDQYIDTQVSRTRRMIKAVDIATALVLLVAGTIAFLLAVALAEHWLVPGGFGTVGRFVLFAVLLAGTAHVVYWRLAPHFWRPINPVYAAQTIEQSSPSLKNSLLNLLLFRQHRAEIPAAVYDTLEEQAAQGLTRVPIDSAVDRTHLVRLGYVLVGVFTLAALYALFSPKNPLVAAERVLLPWAEIPPASRVSIRDVQPGTTSVARGEVVDVSAEVRGLADDDEVLLRYTTDDQQAVDKAVPMAPTGEGQRFACRLPDAPSPGSSIGVAGDLRYWIEAGDARSRHYAISVVTAPTIVVERVDYDYPDYTGYVDRHIDGLGDIRGIEGTKVTIHARANGPIDEAFIDFEADGRRDIPMQVDGTEATAAFTLALRDDRFTPQHTSYVVRFTNADGRTNRDPVQHPIDVLPDHQPEVELLAPQEKMLDVRLNDTVAIEVEARDPDFALRDVRVQGEASGRQVLDESLLAEQRTGRFTGRYLFTPNEHGLRVGDTVQYWVQAADTRTPHPNVTASGRQTLRIISPDPNRPPNANQKPDQQNHQPGGSQQPQDQQNQNQQNQGQQSEGQQGEQQDGQQQPGGEQGAQGNEQGEGQPNADQQGERQGAEGQQQQDGARDGGQSQDQPGGAEGAPGIGREGEAQQQRGEAGRQSGQPGELDHNGANKRGGEAGDGGQHQPASDQGRPGAEPKENQSPVSPDGDNDGEAFDRIGKFLRQHGELGDQKQGDQTPSARDQAESKNQAIGEPASTGGEHDKDAQRKDGGKPESRDQAGPSKDDQDAGPGAETKPGQPDREPNQQQPDESASQHDKSNSPGGQQTSSKGPSGAGDQPAQDQGSPDSEHDMKPADKWQQRPSDGSQTDDQEPPAGGRGKRESDSQGEQGGDRAGGGQEGGGQQAPREGTGSAGQNQSADEGAGESSEKGAGHDSPNAGQDATADKQTGQSGGQQGQGSQRREGQGDQAGGQADRQAGGEDSPARSEDQAHSKDKQADDTARSADSARDGEKQESKERGEPTENSPGTSSGGGGLPGERTIQPGQVDGEVPDADAANLDYARKQTDLVLEKLAEQLKRKQVDQQLLDRLGWTEDELRQFVERWQQLKAAARSDEPSADAARRELDGTLRSLGLRRGPLQQGPVKEDQLRDLREGYRGPVPLQYQDRLRAYNEGISRSQQDGD